MPSASPLVLCAPLAGGLRGGDLGLVCTAPITVTVIPLTEVSDPVFAQAFVGHGGAIDIVHL
ncbi:PTS glucose transporter subunit IIA [Brevibacterium linens ATCC 9172]|nr:PTS glucose transporter subunit IIA [Brevibacterium linens ATCC 9172]